MANIGFAIYAVLFCCGVVLAVPCIVVFWLLDEMLQRRHGK